MTERPARELPDFEEHVFALKRHHYALVIPVINEGERIRRQLHRIAAAAPKVDVVIADGGSTDGSLDADFLQQTMVNALLVKKGPGKVGAQLRMAYSWVLDRGYKGVLTMDGNGKDGVEAIGLFVEKLEQGFAYVQGSRYLPGGQSINVPLDRKIGGRLIHAPILSLAGRRWYTDTTNGFRGYSRQYLLDPRVSPFRAVFDKYSLLFYLTVRAGQLGYRSTEIPVTRAYPLGEATPTKIRGIRGKLHHFSEVVAVALGRYHPSGNDSAGNADC